MGKLVIPLENSEGEQREHEALPLRPDCGQDRRMAGTARVSERITWVTTGGGAFALGQLVAVLNHYGYEFVPWAWAVWAALVALLSVVCICLTAHLGWVEGERFLSRLRTRNRLPLYGRPPPPAVGKYIVGGRAEDEPGTSIGPMLITEALKRWKDEDAEYIPLDEAGQWLYDNGEQWLRDHLKDRRPFNSITEHASALVGSAADEGVGELRASREPGLKPEKIKYSELRGNAFDNMFGGDRPKPVNPVFRRADLPKLLDYYKKPLTPEQPIRVRRDTALREALVFAVTGSWGGDPWADGASRLGEIGSAIEKARQLAADGSITVWGKADNYGVWQRIDRAYWVNHYIDLLDVLKSETRTKAYNTISNEPLFIDLMVSRAEFESEWREA